MFIACRVLATMMVGMRFNSSCDYLITTK